MGVCALLAIPPASVAAITRLPLAGASNTNARPGSALRISTSRVLRWPKTWTPVVLGMSPLIPTTIRLPETVGACGSPSWMPRLVKWIHCVPPCCCLNPPSDGLRGDSR